MKDNFTSINFFHSTCDHCHEKRTNRDFFTVTLHFLTDKDSDIKSLVIATRETSCKTAEQIKADFNSIVESFNIKDKIKTMVTDSFSTNKSVFEGRSDIDWFFCSAHNLNLVLSHSFEFSQSDLKIQSLADIDKLITKT